jgi:hypothetical protein
LIFLAVLLLLFPGGGAVRAAQAATSLAALKARLAQQIAQLHAALGKLKTPNPPALTAAETAAGGMRTWRTVGVHHWSIPPTARLIDIGVSGGSGGAGNAGWVRAPSDGLAYTCQLEQACFGAGGGGGGASAVVVGGTLLAVAPGGGGGGGGVRHDLGGGRGGSGGSGAEVFGIMRPVVATMKNWRACQPRCLYAGERVLIYVGGGGGGAHGSVPGAGGLGYGGPGGSGGARCGRAGSSGGHYGGGGGGGGACLWDAPGGKGGAGAYGGGGGAGAQGGLACSNRGGAGGTFPGEGYLPGMWHEPYGEPGACGGGTGGIATTRIAVPVGAGHLAIVRGTEERPAAPAGATGSVEITWSH